MAGTYVQEDLTWLHEDTDAEEFCRTSFFYREYMARLRGGQHPEVWEVNGGADGPTLGGYTMLWIPEESIFLLLNCGLDPAWYYSPLTRDGLLAQLAGEDDFMGPLRYCTELACYWPRATECTNCGGAVDRSDWELAIYCSDGYRPSVQCEACMRAAYEDMKQEMGW